MSDTLAYIIGTWVSLPWIVVLLRAAASPFFLYVCSGTRTELAERVSLDVFAYIAALIATIPWGTWDKWQHKSTMQGTRGPVVCWSICLIVSILLNSGAAALLLTTRFRSVGNLANCHNCPHSDIPEELNCGKALGSDFFYNPNNYCPVALQQQCPPSVGTNATDLSHCPLYGCSIRFLPLQTICFWMLVTILILNTIVLLGLCVVAQKDVESLSKTFRLPNNLLGLQTNTDTAQATSPTPTQRPNAPTTQQMTQESTPTPASAPNSAANNAATASTGGTPSAGGASTGGAGTGETASALNTLKRRYPRLIMPLPASANAAAHNV